MRSSFIDKVTMTFDLIRYLGQNKDTKKTECSAKLHIVMPTLHYVADISDTSKRALNGSPSPRPCGR